MVIFFLLLLLKRFRKKNKNQSSFSTRNPHHLDTSILLSLSLSHRPYVFTWWQEPLLAATVVLVLSVYSYYSNVSKDHGHGHGLFSCDGWDASVLLSLALHCMRSMDGAMHTDYRDDSSILFMATVLATSTSCCVSFTIQPEPLVVAFGSIDIWWCHSATWSICIHACVISNHFVCTHTHTHTYADMLLHPHLKIGTLLAIVYECFGERVQYSYTMHLNLGIVALTFFLSLCFAFPFLAFRSCATVAVCTICRIYLDILVQRQSSMHVLLVKLSQCFFCPQINSMLTCMHISMVFNW